MKFIFGVLVGIVMGALLVVGTVGGFFAGVAIMMASDKDKSKADEAPTTEPEIPIT